MKLLNCAANTMYATKIPRTIAHHQTLDRLLECLRASRQDHVIAVGKNLLAGLDTKIHRSVCDAFRLKLAKIVIARSRLYRLIVSSEGFCFEFHDIRQRNHLALNVAHPDPPDVLRLLVFLVQQLDADIVAMAGIVGVLGDLKLPTSALTSLAIL